MPESIPRRRKVRTILQGRIGLVAGKTQEVTPIMDEFVKHPARDQGSCPLLGADEIQRKQQKQATKHKPRPEVAKWDDGKRGWSRNGANSGLQHICISWDHASRPSARSRAERRSDFRPRGRSQWRDRAGVAPASLVRRYGLALR